jgi:hypothetical protein
MAGVPRYDSFQVVPTGPASTTFRAPSTDGLGIGAEQLRAASEAAGQVGDSLQRVLADRQVTINEAKVKDADNELSERLRQVLTDPKTGYLNQAGRNAVDAQDGARQQVDKAIRDVGAGITNPAQQEMWKAAAERRRILAQGQVDEHFTQQSKVYAVESAGARIKTQMQNAAAYYTDAQQIRTARDSMYAEIDHIAGIKGMGDDERKQAHLEASTMLHKGVIDAYVGADRPSDALKYLGAAKDAGEIDPTKYDEIHKGLIEVATKADSMRLADRLSDQFGDPSVGREAAPVKLFDKGQVSPEVRDATSQRLWANYSRSRSLLSEEREDTRWQWSQEEHVRAAEDRSKRELGIEDASFFGVQGMLKSIIPGVNITSGYRTPGEQAALVARGVTRATHSAHTDWRAMDIEVPSGMTPPQLAGMLEGKGLVGVRVIPESGKGRNQGTGRHWHIQWDGVRADGSVKSDPSIYATLVQAATRDPTGFARQWDPSHFGDVLSASDLKHFSDVAGDAAKNGGKARNYMEATDKALGMLKPELQAAGIATGNTNPGSAEAVRFGNFQRRLLEEAERLSKKNGGAVSPEDLIKVGRGLMGGMRTANGATKYGFEVQVADLQVPFARIPTQDRNWIITNFNQTEGRQPKVFEVESLYANLRRRGVLR